jgi:hypothetical protein
MEAKEVFELAQILFICDQGVTGKIFLPLKISQESRHVFHGSFP